MATPIIARFTFHADRAEDFTFDGRQVIEMELDTIDEVQEYCEQFQDALLDVQAIVNGRVVCLSDFSYDI